MGWSSSWKAVEDKKMGKIFLGEARAVPTLVACPSMAWLFKRFFIVVTLTM